MVEPDLPDEERAWIQQKLGELRKTLGKTTKDGFVEASWQDVRTWLVQRAPAHKVSQEAIRLAGKDGEAGPKVLRLLQVALGAEPTRETERTERYPGVELAFARARAARVDKAILDNVRRFRVGTWKSESGPSEAEVEEMIRDEISKTRRLETLYSADDIDVVATKGKGR